MNKSFNYGRALIVATTLTLSVACSSESAQNTTEDGSNPIEVMLPGHSTDLPQDDSPVLVALEEETGRDVTLNWVPSTSYDDKFNIMLASGELPTLLVIPSKTPSFVNAARSGAFWDLTPYLDEYPSLSQMNETIKTNASIDGKTYGIYRGRALGRNGVTIRQDWLDNLGLSQPETVDEFIEVLRAFTNDDPDGNGQDDTYGFVTSKGAGSFITMQTWMGLPNEWGETDEGKLMPTHTFPEYVDVLTTFREMYADGLVNTDFAVKDGASSPDEVINGKAGVLIGVADHAQRVQEAIIEQGGEGIVDAMQPPAGPKGQRAVPTSGYNGLIAISKKAVPTEEDLKGVLTFLDQVNSEKIQNLLDFGLEGRHYEKEADYLVRTEDTALLAEMNSLNQLLMYIPRLDRITVEQTPIRQKVADVQKANEEIIVANPAEPLISDEYAKNGAQLDKIVDESRIKYIVGQIDKNQLNAELERWMKVGGEEYIKEINELYSQGN
ncbi:extracellular solute-binding protein [Aureibacillus halotolerans]|uniref:Putative aldouronate transport system substrate-binding protein n=1 Tax=Aureibacillus halotolerans TaxID=1508390 RepID=A0A4R6UDI7_9BACI|nr:extracellular solute-binding protein [Aureibacillus halotolerans]TDQ42855.1 putative aldouronate transport system substrate-binding protein [Aureibacillus halotolerans]